MLPAASFLEHDDLVVSYFHHSISAQAKVVDPPGQALPNSEIFRRLAAAMGYDGAELHEIGRPDPGPAHGARRAPSIDFRPDLASAPSGPTARPRLQFADLRFGTPSGRIELASASAEADGHPRLPRPPTPTPARPEAGCGSCRRRRPGASTAATATTAGRAPAGALAVTLQPGRGRTGAGWLPATSPVSTTTSASCACRWPSARTCPAMSRLIPKGRWPKLEPAGGNVNALNPGLRSDLATAPRFTGPKCTSRPWRAGEHGSHDATDGRHRRRHQQP